MSAPRTAQVRPPVPRRLDTWGWCWHGQVIEPYNAESYVQLSNGERYRLDYQLTDGIEPGHWSYLWDIGLPDRIPTGDEIGAGAAWWGRALLRFGRGRLVAYGGTHFRTNEWPVQLDGQVGRVWMQTARSGDSLAFVFEFNHSIIGQAASPVRVELPAMDVGQTGQPPVYTGRTQGSPQIEGWVLTLIDILPNGRSALFSITPSFSNDWRRGGFAMLGLLRVDVGGTLAAPTASVTVVHNRTSAMGDLVDELDDGMAVVRLGAHPATTTGNPVWPSCETQVTTRPAGYERGAADADMSGYEGTSTARYGQRNALVAAWFRGDGSVAEVRIDALAEVTATSTITDNSSGARVITSTYRNNGSQCVGGDTTIEDDSVYELVGQREEVQRYNLVLRGPDGETVDTLQLERREHLHDRWRLTTDGRDVEASVVQVSYEVLENGEERHRATDPPKQTNWGRNPWGYNLTRVGVGYSAQNGLWQQWRLDHSVIYASNRTVCLARLQRNIENGGGPYQVRYGPLITSRGLYPDPVSITVPITSIYPLEDGFSRTDMRPVNRCSLNIVTGQVERHRADIISHGWV